MRPVQTSALRRRVQQVARDLRMMFSGFAGPSPPPVLRDGVREWRWATVAGPGWRALVVDEVIRETPDAISVWFRTPASGFSPRAGEFVSIRVSVDGTMLKRAYSICTPPGLDRFAITVKRVAQGVVSNHLNDTLSAGDTVEVLGPSGAFTFEPRQDAARHLLLVGGGSGITPLMAIAQAALRDEPATRVTLLYGNGDLDHVIFREVLDGLARDHAGRLTLRHVLERPPADWGGGVGRLDEAVLGAELPALLAGAELDAVYLCGPAPMMDGARAALTRAGVPPTVIKVERFQSPGRSSELPTAPQQIRVALGDRLLATRAEPGQTILEAALEAGIPLPYSCTLGGCGACRVKLTAGAVAMDEPHCLSDAEVAEGYVLTCVGRATRDVSLKVTG